SERPVAFMFPGQGAQYVNMGLDLYRNEPVFREQIDLCSTILAPRLGLDLRDVLYPKGDEESAVKQLNQTAVTRPALFVVEYCLARLIMHWGIKPQAMIGHSIGEFVAGCLAGVFSLADALAVVGTRARLMNQLPAGSMLAVPLSREELSGLLGQELSLAALNGPSMSVVSGPTEAVEKFEKELGRRGVESRRLHTSHAFHSKMMDPMLEPFAEQLRKVKRAAPTIPYLSNVTGTWITAADAADPYYWTKHLRQAVRFAEGVQQLLNEPGRVLLEVGPGQTLTALARQQAGRSVEQVVASMRHPRDASSDQAVLLNAVGKLWLKGVRVDWSNLHGKKRLRVPLPTYPFERQRYWIEPARPDSRGDHRRAPSGKKPDIADWFYLPSWKRSAFPPLPSVALEDGTTSWLVFIDEQGVGRAVVERLRRGGRSVVAVSAGEKFAANGAGLYTINPRERQDYNLLLQELRAEDKLPGRIVHLWSVSDAAASPEKELFDETLARGFYSLVYLARALAEHVTSAIQIDVVS